MAGNVRFDIEVNIQNAGVLPEIEGRLKDLSPAFAAIIREWADLNEQKFNRSRGAEAAGAQVDDAVFWDPLAPSTMKAKRRAGQPDHIMVATGALLRSLSDPDLFFQSVSAEEAVFGNPLAPEESSKIYYNWSRRQALFISSLDQNSIRRIIQDYLSLGPDFERIRFARGMQNLNLRNEAAALDAEFNVGDTGDGF